MTQAVISDTRAMISGMTPEKVPGLVHFCKVAFDDPQLDWLIKQARATFREAEDMTLILDDEIAVSVGHAGVQPMGQITLGVYSSLEGFGLTAAVAAALSAQGIACNMVAAFHHDHAFVPAANVDAAMACLRALASEASL